MENTKYISRLKYRKGKKSFMRLAEMEKFGMDPERIKLLPWFNEKEVLVGLHLDESKAIGSHWIGWVLYENGETLTQSFSNKPDAHDWIIAKGERHIRRKKIQNHLALYQLSIIIVLLILLVIFSVVKLYT